MGRTVQVPAIVSLVAVLIGGVLLGIVGALVAIPVAAAVRLLLHEIAIRRLDKSWELNSRSSRGVSTHGGRSCDHAVCGKNPVHAQTLAAR